MYYTVCNCKSYIICELWIYIVLLPQRCSLIVNGKACELSPSFIVSINAKNDQYMIGVVCEDHMEQMNKRLESLQAIGRIPNGAIQFQPIKMVSTDCIRGTDEDRM